MRFSENKGPQYYRMPSCRRRETVVCVKRTTYREGAFHAPYALFHQSRLPHSKTDLLRGGITEIGSCLLRQRLQSRDDVGMLVGDVRGFGRIGVEVEQRE